MIQRNDKLSRGLRGDKDVPVDDDVNDKTTNNGGDGKINDTSPDVVVGSGKDLKEDSKLNNDVEPLKALDQQVIEWNQKLVSENKNLHQVIKFIARFLVSTFFENLYVLRGPQL